MDLPILHVNPLPSTDSGVENIFLEQQKRARGLTTFMVYPFPSKVVEVPYPLDAKGHLLSPELLQAHARSHEFDMPRCFHGEESKVFVIPDGGEDDDQPNVVLVCGHSADKRCKFRVDVTKMLHEIPAIPCRQYCFSRSSPATSMSSVRAWTPVSLPSIEYTYKRPRTSDFDADSVTGQSVVSGGDAPINHELPANNDTVSSACNEQRKKPYGTDNQQTETGLKNTAIQVDHLGPLQVKVEAFPMGRSSRPVNPRIRKVRESASTIYDEDVYPLRARRDGTSSLISCIDPKTHEYSHDLFIAQIIKDICAIGYDAMTETLLI